MSKDEYTADLITLLDDDGAEHEFEILDILHNDKGCFYALIPTVDSPEELAEADGLYYIFEEIEDNGEKQLAEIEDDDLLEELSEIFEKRFEDMYTMNEDSE